MNTLEYRENVFPTHVGMDLICRIFRGSSVSFPHTRGDGPCTGLLYRVPEMFSPHTWGWTQASGHVELAVSVFPTHVGMDHIIPQPIQLMQGFPHTRGDGPWLQFARYNDMEFSPHTWMDLRFKDCRKSFRGFPHTRGDGPLLKLGLSLPEVFSPHTWGWTL